ncbi:SRPBCC family protein [Parasediminibacterium paludis]|uniref:SRPBCC family protein n=1 Tax=Parasediminibacterium paludis TaxID=908966 RepID=A0ABV8PVP2_9BACT
MKSINKNAPVTCSKTIIINADINKVWNVLTNINDWHLWQTDISKSIIIGELQANTNFVWKTGGANIKSTLHTVVPNKQFGWTGKTFGMFAIHNWTISEQNNGTTTVLVEESMEGLLATLFKRAFNKSLENGMEKWLHLLKQTCELSN